MIEKIVTEFFKLNQITNDHFNKEESQEIYSFILNVTHLKLKTKMIIYELDNLIELYSKHIFNITEEFYSKKYRTKHSRKSKKNLDVANKINGNPNHKISDEVTLLFYVGLYHKIENYENEILEFYNKLNDTNFKSLKSIGLDIPNKKKLFEDRDRIRIICNSIKHNNYYPKNELLKFYDYLSIDQKISLKDFNPKEDVELVKTYIKYFNVLVIFKCLLTNVEQLKKHNLNFPIELKDYFEKFTIDESYKDEKYMLTYLKK